MPTTYIKNNSLSARHQSFALFYSFSFNNENLATLLATFHISTVVGNQISAKNMKKRYIVFVSSTKMDLEQEREAIINSIIELNHIPASMEFFPASNRKSWSYIQKVIDDCDYYVLILGAIYGSIETSSGKSFTEKEFLYAREKGIPTIAFLHENPNKLPFELHDNKEKLLEFYELVKEQTLCRFWSNKRDLSRMLVSSLVKLIEENPQIGWIKADNQTLSENSV